MTPRRGNSRSPPLAKRFRTYGRAYFTLISCPDIEPTNNVAERALRFCVIDRRITQGTRGPKGQQWCERFWTICETCRQQGISVRRFIQQAIHASCQGHDTTLLATHLTQTRERLRIFIYPSPLHILLLA